MEPGKIMCYKTTGELCTILGENKINPKLTNIRRPVMSHENGISHIYETVYDFELETVEDHLRREAKEMLLKVRIQDEMTEEMEAGKKAKTANLLVN